VTEKKVRPKVTQRRSADENHEVITIHGGRGQYRRQPCGGCPWRVDQTGEFPAEAFRHSAGTAYDMATHTFGCHEAGPGNPVTCAGFLLRGAEHNLTVRMKLATGAINPGSVTDGGHELHEDYVAMAVANGCSESDEQLIACRRSTGSASNPLEERTSSEVVKKFPDR
jgi:hypothetical protein